MKTLHKIINLSLYLFIFLSLMSCTEKINIDLDSDSKRLVVDGHIGTDTTTYSIHLTTTSDYFNSDMSGTPVSNAELFITEIETGRVMWLTEDLVNKGVYKTDPNAYGLQGYNYRLNIAKVDLNNDGDYTSYTATDYMSYIADYNDSTYIRAPFGINVMNRWLGFSTKDTGFNICLWIHEPPTHEYYAFIISKNQMYLDDTLTDYTVMNDDDMPNTGGYFDGFPVGFLGYENPQGKQTWAEGSNIKYNFKHGDVLGVEIRSISKAFYTYNTDVSNIYGGSNPLFGSSPSNVRGNISNGAIGFFAAYSTRCLETVCDTNYTVAMFDSAQKSRKISPKTFVKNASFK